MSISRPANSQEFQDYIIRRLGGEWVPIELTQNELNDITLQALSIYTEMIFDGSKKRVLNLSVTSGQLVYDLHSLVSDKIFSVDEVVPGGFQSSMLPTIYGLSQAEVQFLFSLGKMPSGQMADMDIKMQHFSAFQTMFLPRPDWSFNYGTGELTFEIDPKQYINSSGEAMMHLICSELLDFDGTGQGRFWSNRWLLEYAEALAWVQYGTSLGKMSGMQIPGGGEVNYQAFIDRGMTSKTALEDKAKELNTNPDQFSINMA